MDKIKRVSGKVGSIKISGSTMIGCKISDKKKGEKEKCKSS